MTLIKFMNVKVLRNHRLEVDDFWIQDGLIVDPYRKFFYEGQQPDEVINGNGAIIAPGFIDIQINGAFGVDFSTPQHMETDEGLLKVARGVLQHGVTSFVPTLITSTPETYRTLLPKFFPRSGNSEKGASVLGVHVEGPFISQFKYGAHKKDFIQPHCKDGIETLLRVYGNSFFETVKIITLAPETEGILNAVPILKQKGIVVSAGHSASHIDLGIKAIKSGVSLITHLFNAMEQFHHRDPGLIGLLGTSPETQPYYSLIVDNIHSHPASVKMAYRSHPTGAVLITDAIEAMGLPPGHYKLGTMHVDITDRAYISGTETLAGAIAPMDSLVRNFWKATGCSVVEALEAASLHPAEVLGITDRKGTLRVGGDADFVLLDDNLNVQATYIAGKQAYKIGTPIFAPFVEPCQDTHLKNGNGNGLVGDKMILDNIENHHHSHHTEDHTQPSHFHHYSLDQ